MAKNSKRNRAAEEAAKLAAEEAAEKEDCDDIFRDLLEEEDNKILPPKIEDKEDGNKSIPPKIEDKYGDDEEEKKEGFIKRAGRWVKTQYEKEHKLPSWSFKKIVTTLVGAATGAAVVVTAYKLGEAVGSGAINDQLELEDNGDIKDTESEVIDNDYEE